MVDILSIPAFRSNTNLAKNSRFQVMFGVPQALPEFGNVDILRGLSHKCIDAEISGQSLNTLEARTYGPIFRTPNQVMYSDLTLMFMTSDDMKERLFFYDWMRYIHGDRSYDLSYRDEYSTNLFVDKVSEVENQLQLTVKIYDAYPVHVMPQPMSWADDGFLRTAVQFAYTDYEIIRPSTP